MIRRGEPADAEAIGRLLHDFNTEYEEVTPGPAKIAERVRELLAAGDTIVLLAGDAPYGLAVMRFRPSIWIEKLGFTNREGKPDGPVMYYYERDV